MDTRENFVFFYRSPIGYIRVVTTLTTLTNLDFVDEPNNEDMFHTEDTLPEVMKTALSELDAYFKGTLKTFTVSIGQETTPFRQKVFSELVKIPYGDTISYKELATRIGNPKAMRAVGGANHNNRISIIVPCHRVIGADGALTGYGSGLHRKKFLLELERSNRDS